MLNHCHQQGFVRGIINYKKTTAQPFDKPKITSILESSAMATATRLFLPPYSIFKRMSTVG